MRNLTECREGMKYNNCSCPRTCENTKCQETCVPGCQCPEGTYDNGTSCVALKQCYCIVNGTIRQVRYRSYKIILNSNFKFSNNILYRQFVLRGQVTSRLKTGRYGFITLEKGYCACDVLVKFRNLSF